MLLRKWMWLWVCMFAMVLNLFAGSADYHGWEDCWYLMAIAWGMLAIIESKRIVYYEDIGEE